MFPQLRIFLLTLIRLGAKNVATVLLYKLAIRFRLLEKFMPIGLGYRAAIFPAESVAVIPYESELSNSTGNLYTSQADMQLHGKVVYFSNITLNVGYPPNWFLNPISGACYENPDHHWSYHDEFESEAGDIKVIWEISRFDWMLTYAKAYRTSNNKDYLNAINDWVMDWTDRNPLNRGPNWKCGQETSIRLLQVLLTAFLLGQHQKPTQSLVRLVVEHCTRINPTMRYAIAQDNNHGTSEAAALYIAGSWLQTVCLGRHNLQQKANRWQKSGLFWLENRARKLIANDGSFSQYSVNYHRLLLDTLSIVEFWRRQLGLPPFSSVYYWRSEVATKWLYQLTDRVSGDAPNLGGNDGARLFSLAPTPYRDFRSSVQLAAVLFLGERLYGSGAWDEVLTWLDIKSSWKISNREFESNVFGDGGYAIIRANRHVSWGLLRFPNFRFRPSQCDLLHFDLWHRGTNILRDGGSFSYNVSENKITYFSGTCAHNTIQFDNQEQMPRISRFLFGAWPKARFDESIDVKSSGSKWSAAFENYLGCKHKRTLMVEEKIWTVIDEIEGFHDKAVLRWRLCPGAWVLLDQSCQSNFAILRIEANVPINRCELTPGWESRCYMEETPLPVLEVQVGAGKATIKTEIQLQDP